MSIMEAVEEFEQNRGRILPIHCRENAMRFSTERFHQELLDFVKQAWEGLV
jgi:hypothetical protein